MHRLIKIPTNAFEKITKEKIGNQAKICQTLRTRIAQHLISCE
jgi:hypothetical protein